MDGPTIRLRFDALESLRKTLDDTLQAIEKFILPYRGEFFKPLTSEFEVEWRRRKIYDSTAPVACNLLAAQIHSNLTSPSVRWFSLRFRDAEINDRQDVKKWLQEVEERIWQALLESDFNMEIAETYLDLCGYGTACLFMEEMDENEWQGLNFTAMPVRDSYFEHGGDDKVLRFYRRLQYTQLQLEDRFPNLDEVHKSRKGGAKDVDEKMDVIFCIYERPGYKDINIAQRLEPTARPYAYKYVLHADSYELEEGGYYEMPAFVPRWQKVSGSRWGFSPAFVCLSDVLQLNEVVAQTSESRAKAIDPPMLTTERGILSDLDLSSGGLTVVTALDEIGPLFTGARFDQAEAEIERLQKSIRSTFYIDKLELKDSPQMTATEVMVRYERMQRQFAPTLGRLQADLLDPLVTQALHVLLRAGQLPKVPQIALEQELDIEYTGPIPRAQRNEVAQATSMWIGELGGLANVMPDILDVPNTDAVARALADMRGVPAKLLNSEEDVAAVRKTRAEQQVAMQELAAAEQGGKAMQEVGAGMQVIDGGTAEAA